MNRTASYVIDNTFRAWPDYRELVERVRRDLVWAVFEELYTDGQFDDWTLLRFRHETRPAWGGMPATKHMVVVDVGTVEHRHTVVPSLREYTNRYEWDEINERLNVVKFHRIVLSILLALVFLTAVLS